MHYCPIRRELMSKITSLHSRTLETRRITGKRSLVWTHTSSKVGTTYYARYCFSQQIQAPGKAIRQFAITLRQASKDFDHCKGTEDQIHDEILCKCTSTSHGWGVVSWIWSSIPERAPTSLTEKRAWEWMQKNKVKCKSARTCSKETQCLSTSDTTPCDRMCPLSKFLQQALLPRSVWSIVREITSRWEALQLV